MYTQLYAGRTATLAGSLAAVTNSIVTSLATTASPVVLSGAGLTGANAGTLVVPQNVTVTTAVHASSYVLTPIVVTGTDVNGSVMTENLSLTLVNGGETISGSKAFYTITSISLPAQVDTLGSWTFGTKNYYPGALVLEIRVKTAGTLHVAYNGGFTDTVTALAGDRLPYAVTKIFSDSTAQDITFAYAS